MFFAFCRYTSPNFGEKNSCELFVEECYYKYSACQCDVFYSDPADCYEPCVADPPLSAFISKFTNYLGLAMDVALCFHCFKNYRDIYPSVLSIVMLVTFNGASTAIKNSVGIDNLDDYLTSVLVTLVVNLVVIGQYFKSGCGKIGQACCRGGGLKFQFTCFGTGL